MSNLAAPVGVRFEHRTDDGPVLGIGTATPRLSWIVPAADAGFAQEAYEVEITRAGGDARGRPGRRAPSRCWCPGRPPRWPRASRRRSGSASAAAGRRSDWSEPGDRRGRAARGRGLDRALRQPARARRARRAGARARARPRPARRGRRAPGCTRPRTASTRRRSTAAASATRCSRPAGRATQHRLRYQTYDVTELVRDGRATSSRCCSATAGTAAGSAAAAGRALYGDRLALLAQLEVTTADGAVHVLGHRRHLDRPRERDPRRRPLRRPAHRPARADAGDRSRRRSRSSTRDLGPPGRARRPAGAGHRDRCPRSRSVTLAVRHDAGRLRAEPRRLGAAAGPRRRAGHRGRRPARRGARARRARRPAAADRQGHRHLPAGRRATRRCSSRASPSTASATPRSPACRDLRGRGRRGRRRRLATCARTGWFELVERRCSTGSTRTSSGACAATSSTCPTDCPQRDERLGWTGDIQVFAPDRQLPVRHAPASSAPGWPTSPPSSSRTARSRSSSRTSLDDAGAGRRGLGRRRDDRALGALRAHRRRRRCSRASCRACAPGSTRSPTLAGADRLWTGGFQFGDWLDPTAPPDAARPRRRPTPTSSPPRTSPARPRSSREAARLRRRRRRRRRVRAARRARSAAPSRASTSPPAAACSATPRPSTRWRSQWALLPTRRAARARRRAPRRPRARRRASGSAPASSARR